MKPRSIALIADYGFDPTQNYSHKLILWLKYLSFKLQKRIQHCFNGLEKKIGPYPVDGYCAETDTVYEFQGCWMHGCSKCFHPNTYNTKMSNNGLFIQIMSRKNQLCEKHCI